MFGAPAHALSIFGTIAEGQLYVERPADRVLPAALSEGRLCYVLAPRQIGKSSLRLRTQRRLQAAGVRCATIDLSGLGTQVEAADWYFGLLQEIGEELDVGDTAQEFWRQHGDLPPIQRWSRYLRWHVQDPEAGPLVVFVDELDTLRALPELRDDFLASLRALHNRRADDPSCRRLTFCLLGVVSPGDLILDPSRTPFNVGQSVSLLDFSRDECIAFEPVLSPLGQGSVWMDAIYEWTAGHPYMVQRLCAALLERQARQPSAIEEAVRAAVSELFLLRGRTEETNLSVTDGYFRDQTGVQRGAAMLALYRRILSRETVPAKGDDLVQFGLRLTGIAAERPGPDGPILQVRNQVFARVFDLGWVQEKEMARRIAEPTQRWLGSGKQEDFLLRGAALKEALDWARGREDVTRDERDFLLAGVEWAEKEARILAAARARLLRYQFLAVISLVLGIASVAGYGWWRARVDRAKAVARMHSAHAKMLAEQPGRKREALSEALLGIAPSALSHQPVSDEILHGLAAAVIESLHAPPVTPARALLGHRASVFGVTFSKDGRRALTASSDATARVWDVESGETLLATPMTPGRRVITVAVSPDDLWFVTAGDDPAVHRWDGKDGSLKATWSGHSKRVWGVDVSPDGLRVVTASEDQTARIFEVSSGRTVAVLQGHMNTVYSAMYSPDGKYIVTGSADRTARIWDGYTGAFVRALQGPVRGINFAAFSPDGREVCAASNDGRGYVWDLATGQVRLALEGHKARVLTMLYSPDGKQLLTTSDDQTAVLWNAQTGIPQQVLEGASAAPWKAAFSADGRRIITSSNDRTAYLWNNPGPHATAAYSGHDDLLVAVNYSRDGRRLITSGGDKTVRVWDPRNQQILLYLRPGADSGEARFSPDGRYVVTASEDQRVRIFDAQAGRLLYTLEGQSARYAAALSPDGALLAAQATPSALGLWDWRRGLLLRGLSPVAGAIYSISFSADGQLVAASSSDGMARLWEVHSGRLVTTLSGHEKAVSYLSFSPDGRHLATASFDNTARIWDLHTQKTTAILKGHAGRVWSIVYAPDGQTVATAGDDQTVRFWDSGTGALRMTLEDRSGRIFRIQYAPGGEEVVVGVGAVARVYPATVRGLIHNACQMLGTQAPISLAEEQRPIVTSLCQSIR